MEDYYTEDIFPTSYGDNDFDINVNDMEREIANVDSYYSRQFSSDCIDDILGM